MDYSTFKALQALLFFGSAMGFCVWQLAALRRLRRERARSERRRHRLILFRTTFQSPRARRSEAKPR